MKIVKKRHSWAIKLFVHLLRCVHRFYQVFEGLIHVFPLHFHGRGDLAIFLIKLFGKYREFFYSFHIGQGFIDLIHFPLDQLYGLMALGQIPICGKLDLIFLGIFNHVVLIDHDQRSNKFPIIPDN